MKAKRLLKTPVPGGLLTLTTAELVLGDGFLGTINVRRFPLAELLGYEVQQPPHSTPWQGRIVRFTWANGSSTEIPNVGMLAAERLGHALRALCPQATHAHADMMYNAADVTG
ncbi:MAG: hypothetical protein MUD01_10050 [Chloroflexaceae bacterium]|nr:hypothetical protein [Chloroflexaceae bacterium]